MRFDLETLDPAIVYKLIAATVVPRPIAWITTLDRQGRLNAAPYSFFNAMGSQPPVVAVGIQANPDKGLKDSARNIVETGEFVVNLVPEALIGPMNITAVEAPAGVDETLLASVDVVPSTHVKPPRIVLSPVSFECVNQASLATGPAQSLIVGRVLAVHIEGRFIKDAARGHVDTGAMGLLGRMHGSCYVRLTDTFDHARPTWAQWLAEHGDAQA